MTAVPSATVDVGFIGLGDMGGALVTRILAAGFPTTLWARRPEALEPFEAMGARAAATPAALAAGVDLVGICVWDDAALDEVLGGEAGVLAGARPGTVVAVHSTVRPSTCRRLAGEAAARGVVLIDAPVSGARAGALAGTLLVMVGGDEAVAERCRPVFESFGNPVLRVGPVGTGLLAKLVNNVLFTANIAVADDAIALGGALGIDPGTMGEVLRHGSARSFALEAAIANRFGAGHRKGTLAFLEKDVGILTELAAQECAGVPTLTSVAAETLRRLADPPEGWDPRPGGAAPQAR